MLTPLLPIIRSVPGRLLPPLLWMGVIYALSDRSDLPYPDDLSAKVVSIAGHFSVYAVLAVLFWWALGVVAPGGQRPRPPRGRGYQLPGVQHPRSPRSQLRGPGYRLGGRRRAVLAVIMAVAYGISDEWHQSFVPGRTPDGMDVLVDAAGAIVAMFVVTWIERRVLFRRWNTGGCDGRSDGSGVRRDDAGRL